jgi:hypothetical protein
MKEEFYLRVEGVNLDTFVYDTFDLSTTRGGGLLLLEAIEKIKEKFQSWQPISTGASSGLFSFSVESPKEADELRQKVIKFLTEDEQLRHATFVVDILPVGTDFNKDKETLLAMNRWQQMQSPTLVFPSSHTTNLNRPCCDIDQIRPAIHKVRIKDDEKVISESVYQRRKHGQNQKQKFYEQHTGLSDLPKFVQSFDELTDDNKRGNLHHKMAVIYLDGNGFSNIQQKICQGQEGAVMLQLFDEQIKEYRRKFLSELLETTCRQLEWTTDTGEHRLEILLWGGDEILLVVPAWLGWWTLSYFFQKSESWKFENHSLTHAAGLVFCHHRAPIHDIQELAKRLAELAKNKSRSENYVAYQILESFDTTGPDLESNRQKRLGRLGSQSPELIIPGAKMQEALVYMAPIKRALSKGRVYKIVQAMLYDSPESSKTVDLIKEAENQLTASANDAYQKLQSCFGQGEMFWIHLIDLWDYIEEPTSQEKELCL